MTTDHVRLLPPATLACLHCGETYAFAVPIGILLLAALTKEFGREHNSCIRTERGEVCSLCLQFGHGVTTCPRKDYAGDLLRWRHGPDTGLSSIAIYDTLTGTACPPIDAPSPYDSDDFGRCHRFLAAFPHLRPRIGEMAKLSPAWAALVAHWDELESLYIEDRAADWMEPRLYERIRKLRIEAEGG